MVLTITSIKRGRRRRERKISVLGRERKPGLAGDSERALFVRTERERERQELYIHAYEMKIKF